MARAVTAPVPAPRTQARPEPGRREGDTPPTAEEIGARFVESLTPLGEVVAAAVDPIGIAFRISTVIETFDLDVCERVFRCESALFDLFPHLEADLRVLGSDEWEAKSILRGEGAHEFLWRRVAPS